MYKNKYPGMFLKAILSSAILLLAIPGIYSQAQPLQVQVMIPQPYPTTLEQIMAFEGEVLVTVRNQSQEEQEFKLIPELTMRDARALIADGTISGGMIPKVETCLEALETGVEGVVILNGKTPHVVLVELFTEHGAGTLIVR